MEESPETIDDEHLTKPSDIVPIYFGPDGERLQCLIAVEERDVYEAEGMDYESDTQSLNGGDGDDSSGLDDDMESRRLSTGFRRRLRGRPIGIHSVFRPLKIRSMNGNQTAS